MKKIAVFAMAMFLVSWGKVFAHCQIPCGIYDDRLRISQLREDIETIEKSMKSIIALSKNSEKDYNQIVRWVNNKERHAGHMEEIISYYFMAQRINPQDNKKGEFFEKYIRELTLLHSMLVYTMKAKQGTDLEVAGKLRSLVSDFEESYFKDE